MPINDRMDTDKRNFQRVEIPSKIDVHLTLDLTHQKHKVLDISASGVSFQIDCDLPDGATPSIKLNFPGQSEEIAINIRVVRKTKAEEAVEEKPDAPLKVGASFEKLSIKQKVKIYREMLKLSHYHVIPN